MPPFLYSYNLMMTCWQIEPDVRPRFSRIAEELRAISSGDDDDDEEESRL